METILNISKCVDYQNRHIQEKSLKPKEVINLLNKWFRDLDNPAPPPKSEKVTRSLEGLQKYFTDLNQALREISTDPPKPYIDRLCSARNPYDFAKILEKIVEEVLYSEGRIDPAARKAYYLYYFHSEQLEKAASDKFFSSSKQIGSIWT